MVFSFGVYVGVCRIWGLGVGWLCGIGVETVTVSSPFLLRIVKTRYPGLKVRISVFAGVDRVRKAQMWEEMGADGIVLDSLLVNREFVDARTDPRIGEMRPRTAGEQQLPLLVRPLPGPHERPGPRRPVVARQPRLLHRLVLPAVHGDEAAKSGELHPLGVDPPGRHSSVRRDGVRPVQGDGAGPSHAGDGRPGAGVCGATVRRQSPRPGPAVRLAGGERERTVLPEGDRVAAKVPPSAGAGQPGPDAPAEAPGGRAAHDASGDGCASGGRRQPGARRLHRTVPGERVPRRGVRGVPLVPRFRREGGPDRPGGEPAGAGGV